MKKKRPRPGLSGAPKPTPAGKPAKRPRPAPAGTTGQAKIGRPSKASRQAAPPPLTFGQRLRAAREGAHMSQQDLGDTIGMDKRSVARYEQGGALPSIEAAARLAKPLGASLDALAGMPAVAGTDPELSRLLARFADLNDFDRAALRRVIAMALAGM